MHFIGLDIGTSAVKAVIVDHRQTIVAEASAPLAISVPQPGWSEQHPDAWWDAALSALSSLRRAAGSVWQDVGAIGLSGQMHGAVLLDKDLVPIRPAILWNDGRSAAECSELEALLPDIGMMAGVRAMPGFTAPKLMWLKSHEPAAHRRITHVLLPKDYVRLKLTGELATDMSDAAGTLWLDQARRCWNPQVIAASGIDPGQLPRLMEGTSAGGVLTRVVADELGLARSVVVAAGAGDAAAGAAGIGAVNENDAFLSLGTSSQLFVATATYRPRPEDMLHAFCHAVPDRWFLMAAMLNGAVCLAWIARQLGEADIGALLARAEHDAPEPSDVVFLPYLSGERTPHNDPSARGAFIGLGPETTPAAMTRAVLEGVAFSVADARDCMLRAGVELSSLAVIGGGSRSMFLMRIVAAAIDTPLTLYHGAEKGPAFGAARLARLAVTGEAVADVCQQPVVDRTIMPDPALAAVYRRRLEHYRDLYRRLKGGFLPSA